MRRLIAKTFKNKSAARKFCMRGIKVVSQYRQISFTAKRGNYCVIYEKGE